MHHTPPSTHLFLPLQAFWKDFERTPLLISRSVLVQPNPTNTSLPPFPILDFNYMTSAAQLADNVTVSFKELEIQNSQASAFAALPHERCV